MMLPQRHVRLRGTQVLVAELRIVNSATLTSLALHHAIEFAVRGMHAVAHWSVYVAVQTHAPKQIVCYAVLQRKTSTSRIDNA